MIKEVSKWLTNQNESFVMISDHGTVLFGFAAELVAAKLVAFNKSSLSELIMASLAFSILSLALDMIIT